MIQEEKKNNILQWTVAGLINCHCAYCLQGRVLSPAAGAGIVPAAGVLVCYSLLVQGVNRLLWAGWAVTAGPLQPPPQLLSRGPGAEADTRATRAADLCTCHTCVCEEEYT